jgi:hypothetical protein
VLRSRWPGTRSSNCDGDALRQSLWENVDAEDTIVSTMDETWPRPALLQVEILLGDILVGMCQWPMDCAGEGCSRQRKITFHGLVS